MLCLIDGLSFFEKTKVSLEHNEYLKSLGTKYVICAWGFLSVCVCVCVCCTEGRGYEGREVMVERSENKIREIFQMQYFSDFSELVPGKRQSRCMLKMHIASPIPSLQNRNSTLRPEDRDFISHHRKY